MFHTCVFSIFWYPSNFKQTIDNWMHLFHLWFIDSVAIHVCRVGKGVHLDVSRWVLEVQAMAIEYEWTLQTPAFVVAILGWITSFVALLTPAWQVVYARELQQWIQSGLWLNCQTRPSGMYTCTYTFNEADFNFYTSAEIVDWRTPPFYGKNLEGHCHHTLNLCSFFSLATAPSRRVPRRPSCSLRRADFLLLCLATQWSPTQFFNVHRRHRSCK